MSSNHQEPETHKHHPSDERDAPMPSIDKTSIQTTNSGIPLSTPEQPADAHDLHIDDDETVKRPAVRPPSPSHPQQTTDSRQEKARQYLQRKQARQEHITAPTPAIQTNRYSIPADTTVTSDRHGFTLSVQHTGRDVGLYRQDIGGTSQEHRQSHRQVQVLQHKKKLWLRHLSRKHWRQNCLDEKRSFTRLWTVLISTSVASLLIFLTVAGSSAFVSYTFYNQTQNQFASRVITLHDLLPLDNLKMYDSHGILLTQLTDRGLQTSVPLNQISPNLINATVATEDKTFWTNPGVDITRIVQAAIDNLEHGQVISGASTITQQLIKNLVLQNQDQTLLRKLQEIVLTPSVNSYYSKKDIMQMYLNSIPYGEQTDGIDAAAHIYFGLNDRPGKSAASQLDLAQSAMLAGIPSAPSTYDPLLHPQAAYNRCAEVLDLMVKNDYITAAQAREALAETQRPGFYKLPSDYGVNRAPHFEEFVLEQLEQTYHKTRAQLSRSGMSVYTTLDITLQDKIQKIMQEHIAELKSNNVTNAAEVLIDFHTGAIRSLLGSINYYDKSIDGAFDVATQGYRQPGSSFKPYVYVTAFENGASPGQAIDDSPLSVPQQSGPNFAPTNYDLHYHGHMTLRCALQNSLNVPAVKVLQHVGIDAAMKTAQEMGISSYNGTPGLSLVLGGLGVHLIDHTSAFGTFANGGVHVPYYAIQKVVFSNTQQTFGHAANAGQRVISPQLAYMMTNVLSDNTDRLPEFYDCNVLQLYANSQTACYYGNRGAVRPAAVKTGTTNDFRDNWTIGYTTDFVMGVWAGNDNNTPMKNVTGVQGAAPIWHDSMLLAEQGQPIRDFTDPGGLQTATVTYPDGVRSTDLYLPGKVPSFTQTGATRSATPATATKTATTTTATVTTPYCSDFSYAFPPSANDYLNGSSPNPGWW